MEGSLFFKFFNDNPADLLTGKEAKKTQNKFIKLTKQYDPQSFHKTQHARKDKGRLLKKAII